MSWIVDSCRLPANSHADVAATLFTVGNGALGIRGTAGEAGAETFRGSYAAGAYTPAGWGLLYYLPLPDATRLRWYAGAAELVVSGAEEHLDLQTGTMISERSVTGAGISLRVREERCASWAVDELVIQRLTVTVDSCAAPVDLHLGIDGGVFSHPAKYYVDVDLPNVTDDGVRLTSVTACSAAADGLAVHLYARQSDSSAVARARIEADRAWRPQATAEQADAVLTLSAEDAGTDVVVTKIIATGGQRGADDDVDGRCAAALAAVSDAASALAAHQQAVADFWQRADVVIDGDDRAQLAVRYGLWSTRIAAPADDGQGSIGAKNLTGDWYRGAVFWDAEMFCLPLLAAVAPERARNHLRYRAKRLYAARRLAAQDGYAGARFPWQSYATGLEEPPVMGGFLATQQHVGLAVAHAALRWWWHSGDAAGTIADGLPIIIEIARFWQSRLVAGDDGRLHCHKVTGPDEDHRTLEDEAYTMVLAGRMLQAPQQLVAELSDAGHADAVATALQELDATPEELATLAALAPQIAVPMLADGVTLAQYADYAEAPEPDETLVGLQGSRPDKPSKQPAVLLLWQVIPEAMAADALAPNFREYAALCNHGSSLSFCSHALLAIRLGRQRDAMRLYAATAGIDLEDSHGNSCHGIHSAGEAGIWLATVGGFGGFRVGADGVHLDPRLPEDWRSLSYGVIVHGVPLRVTVTADAVTVQNNGAADATVHLGGAAWTIAAGASDRRTWSADWQHNKLEAVIFDLDGVLVTTDRYHYAAWKELADGIGLPFDETVNHRLRGVSRAESLRRIYEAAGVDLPDEDIFNAQLTEKNTRYVELIQAMGPDDILPGAVDLLQNLRAAGIRTAIASASRNAPLVLERTGLAGLVDAVADGSIVTASKPDPQVFHLAAQRVRCIPWNCVGIEDAAAGVEAIHRAGMVAVGIGSEGAAAEVQVDATSALTVDVLRQAFAEHENPVNPYLEHTLARMVEDQNTAYAATLASK